ncbi:transporter substrate-binding domain-containing protein [Streptomyces sp. Pv4-95]|uniref:transporter substrate-binding domain-containing protein n=1 Tax=Streptomyces sp. Pv4-95 TaxID=3049543 RepID=UPI00389128BF
MTAKPRLLLIGASCLLVAATACGPGGTPDAKQSSTPEPTVEPLLKGGVTVAVKIDQPGFNVHSPAEHNYAGFDNDLSVYLARKLNYTASPTDVESKRREEVLRPGGAADLVIATYSITDSRRSKVDFAGPYLNTRQGLLVKKGYTGIKNRNDTAGKAICTAEGSTSDPNSTAISTDPEKTREAVRNLLHKDARVETRKDYRQCVEELRRGDFEAVWTDRVLLYGFAEVYDDVEVIKDFSTGELQRYGIGLPKGHPKDCAKLVEGLRDFLQYRWKDAFRSHFPKLAQLDRDFENTYKPDPSQLEGYSCQSGEPGKSG